MDRNLEQEIQLLTKKLESALEIIMDHFHDSEERMDAIEDRISTVENANGTSKTISE